MSTLDEFLLNIETWRAVVLTTVAPQHFSGHVSSVRELSIFQENSIKTSVEIDWRPAMHELVSPPDVIVRIGDFKKVPFLVTNK